MTFDPGSFRSIFLFEDIAATHGASFLNAHHEFSRADAERMVAVIAAYHGRFWNSPALNGEFFWLKDALTNQHDINNFIAFQERTTIGLERVKPLLPAKLQARATKLWPAMMRSMQPDDLGRINVERMAIAVADLDTLDAIG